MSDRGYKQYTKNFVRHSVIKYAVSMLTTQRQNATCVHRDYVREVYDYFTKTEDESRNKLEALRIHHRYILDWEHLHDSFCQPKSPEELSICYLCGPEPNNDFDEFVALGVLPQNIWAFEADKKTYEKALSVYETETYRQPRIIKQNIETFFQQTPKKFDIIYIDACGSIPSSQHALRCISTIFQFHRLVSPGIVISNFAAPDDKDDYVPLLGQYFYSKKNSPYSFSAEGELDSPEYLELLQQIACNFSLYYGDFISFVLRDIIMHVRRIAAEYGGVIFRAQDTRMKVEELITSLAYLDYRTTHTGAALDHMLNVYKKHGQLCARIASKETVTNTLSELSNKNPTLFIPSVESVEKFAQKVYLLIDQKPAKLKELFSHSRKGTQHKTDQNYYLLWAMLRKLSDQEILAQKERVFDAATKMFSVIQKSPDEYSVEDFFADIAKFPNQ